MATLIEHLYNKDNININEIFTKKVKDLSLFDKHILGIEHFHGYQNNTIYDVIFLNRIPLQIMWNRYKFLVKNKLTSDIKK